MRNIQSNCSAAALRIARRIHGIATRVGQLDQTRRQAKAFLSDRFDARAAESLRSLGGGVEGRNDGSTIQPAEGASCVLHVFFESEGARVRLPAGEGRLQLIADLWAHVKEAGARSTAQPFENATGEKIGLAPFHVNRHDADGMERIERNKRAELVSALTDCVDIHQKCATKEDLRGGAEARPFV